MIGQGMDPLLKDWIQVGSWSVAILGGLIAAFVGLYQLRASRRQRETELRWNRAKLGSELFDRMFTTSGEALLMLDYYPDRRAFAAIPAEDKTVGLQDILTALDRTSRTDKSIYIRERLDELFYIFERIEYAVENELVTLDDVLYPSEYYVAILAKQKEEYAKYLEDVGYKKTLKFLDRFPKWKGSNFNRSPLRKLSLFAASWLTSRFVKRPGIERYAAHVLASEDTSVSGLRVTFLGVSTLLFDDGETAVLTDGFFTRPGKLRTLFTRIEPDREVIARCLRRAGIERLGAVLVLHSHYDHALDSAVVAQLTGARLIGSESTAMIGRGYDFPEERIDVIQDGTVTQAGRFKITWLLSRHAPPLRFMGNIDEPLRPPARVSEYKEGGSYAVLIEHDGKRALVHATAGSREGSLSGHRADVVFLGVGTLGKFDESDREAYWREVVEAVKPSRVIPIHWDNFWLPLEQPLAPMPRPLDDFDKSMAFLLRRVRGTEIDVKILPAWVTVYPFRRI